MKREVAASQLGNAPEEFVYTYVLYFTGKCRSGFEYQVTGRNGCVGKVTGYFDTELCAFSYIYFPLFLSTGWWELGTEGCPGPSSAQSSAGSGFFLGVQLSDKAVASYQTGCLKTASCKQLPPTPASLPVNFAGCLFQGSILLLSCSSGAATIFDNTLIFYEFESYQLRLKVF